MKNIHNGLRLTVCVLLALLMCFAFAACNKPDTPPDDGAPTLETIVKDGESDYVIIYSKDNNKGGSYAYSINAELGKLPGNKTLTFTNDTAEETAKEILLGDTNRQLSKDLKAELESTAAADSLVWGFAYRDGKFAFYFNSQEAFERGLVQFKEKFIKDDAFTVSSDTWITAEVTQADIQAEIKAEEDRLKAEEEAKREQVIKDREASWPARLAAAQEKNGLFTLTQFDNTSDKYEYSWASNSKYSWVGEPEDITTDVYADPTTTLKSSHPRVMVNSDMIAKIKAIVFSKELDEDMQTLVDTFWKYADAEADGIFEEKTGTKADGTGNTYRYDGTEMTYIEAKAFAYLLTGEKAYAYEAIVGAKNMILNIDYSTNIHMDVYHGYGHAVLVASFVYDWCYNVLSAEDKQMFINGVHNYLFRNLEFYYPPSNMNGVSGHGTGPQLFRHYLTAAVAFADERPDWWDYVGGRFYQEYVPVCNELFKGGWVSQGTSTYGPGKLFSYLWSGWLLETATGVMPYNAEGLQACSYDLFGQITPNDRYFQSGDGNRNREGTAVSSHWMFITSAMFNDDVTLAAAKKFSSNYTKFNNTDFQTTTPSLVLIYLANMTKAPVENYEDELDLIYFTPYPGNQMTAKNSFGDDAAAVFMKIGGLYTSNHDNKDAGTFQIYYKDLLACTSGSYDKYGAPQHKYYLQATISHNGLLIYNPNLKNTKDGWYSGGQETVPNAQNYDAWTNGSCLVGELIGYDYKISSGKAKYAYIAGDITKGYNSQTVDYVGRRMLTVYTDNADFPMIFFVFDSIESDDASYKKTFLLHTIEQPEINTDNLSAVIVNGDGKMYFQNMTGGDKIQKIGGSGYAYWIGNENDFDGTEASGKNCIDEETPNDDASIIWGRIEVTASGEERTDMLSVMYVTDSSNTKTLTPTAFENDKIALTSISNVTAVFVKSLERNESAIEFTTTGSGKQNYYVSGMYAGTWNVSVDGKTVGSYKVTEDSGLLTFTANAGAVSITPGEDITPSNIGKIVYEMGGGTVSAGAPTTYPYGEATQITATAKRGDDVFMGWYFDDTYTTPATEISADTTGPVKLYAKWNFTMLNEDYSSSTVYTNTGNKTVKSIQYRPNSTGSTFETVKSGSESYLKWTLGSEPDGLNANIITEKVSGKTIADMPDNDCLLSVELKLAREVGKDFLGFSFRLNTPGGTYGRLYLFCIDDDGYVHFGSSADGQVIGYIPDDGSWYSVRVVVDFNNGKLFYYDGNGDYIANTNGTADTADDTDYFTFSVPSSYASEVKSTAEWRKNFDGYYFFLDEAGYGPEDGGRVAKFGLIKMVQGNIFE